MTTTTESTQRAVPPIRNMVSYGIGKLAPGLLLFASIPVWVSIFGTAEYGRFSIAWAAATVASSLGVGWLRQAILRGSGTSDWSLTGFLTRRTAATLSILIALALIAVSGSDLAGHEESLPLSAALFGLVYSGYAVVQAQAQRQTQALLFAAAEVGRTCSALAFSLGMVALDAPKTAVTLLDANTIGCVIGIAVLGLGLVRGGATPSAGTRVDSRAVMMRDMWRFGWPLSLWLGLTTVQVYLDRLVIGYFGTAQDVGAYAAVADLVLRGVPMIAFPVVMAAHPLLMASWNEGRYSEAMAGLRRWTVNMGGLLLVANLLVLILGRWLLHVALPEVEAPLGLLLALSISSSFWQIAQLTHKPLEFLNRTPLMVATLAMATVTTLVADVVLVPTLGPTGAAISSGTAGAAYCLVTWRLGSRRATSGIRSTIRLSLSSSSTGGDK